MGYSWEVQPNAHSLAFGRFCVFCSLGSLAPYLCYSGTPRFCFYCGVLLKGISKCHVLAYTIDCVVLAMAMLWQPYNKQTLTCHYSYTAVNSCAACWIPHQLRSFDARTTRGTVGCLAAKHRLGYVFLQVLPQHRFEHSRAMYPYTIPHEQWPIARRRRQHISARHLRTTWASFVCYSFRRFNFGFFGTSYECIRLVVTNHVDHGLDGRLLEHMCRLSLI